VQASGPKSLVFRPLVIFGGPVQVRVTEKHRKTIQKSWIRCQDLRYRSASRLSSAILPPLTKLTLPMSMARSRRRF
jgi:hypothetical protein